MIQNFRRFAGSHTVQLEPGVTALVGPNSAGKTTVLRALELAAGVNEYRASVDNCHTSNGVTPCIEVSLVPDSEQEARSLARELGLTGATPVTATASIFSITSAPAGAQLPVPTPAAEASTPILGEVGMRLRLGDTRAYLHAVDAGGLTLPTAVEVPIKTVRTVLFDPRYAAELPPLPEAVALDDLDCPAAVTLRRLLRLAGVIEPMPTDPLARDQADRRMSQALEAAFAAVELPSIVRHIRTTVHGRTLRVSVEGQFGEPMPPTSLGDGNNWLLAFAIWYATEVQTTHPVLMLDEPAAHLDPRNQKQVRGFLERLSAHAQVLYATHSPYLIDRRHPERLIMVGERRGQPRLWKGVRFGPLREALGLVGGDSFLFGLGNAVVEGDADRVYFDQFAEHIGIDPDEVHFVSAGGASNVAHWVGVLRDLDTPVVAILDNDKAGREAAALMRRRNVPDEQIFFPYADATTADKAIEDWLDEPTFLSAVNSIRCPGETGLLTGHEFADFRARERPHPDAPPFAQLPIALGVADWLRRHSGQELDKIAVAEEYCRVVAGKPTAVLEKLLRDAIAALRC